MSQTAQASQDLEQTETLEIRDATTGECVVIVADKSIADLVRRQELTFDSQEGESSLERIKMIIEAAGQGRVTASTQGEVEMVTASTQGEGASAVGQGSTEGQQQVTQVTVEGSTEGQVVLSNQGELEIASGEAFTQGQIIQSTDGIIKLEELMGGAGSEVHIIEDVMGASGEVKIAQVSQSNLAQNQFFVSREGEIEIAQLMTQELAEGQILASDGIDIAQVTRGDSSSVQVIVAPGDSEMETAPADREMEVAPADKEMEIAQDNEEQAPGPVIAPPGEQVESEQV